MSSKSRQQPKPRTGRQFWQQFHPAQVPRILAGLQTVLRQPCILCGGKATVPAVFQPNNPLAWGGRPGKLRVCCYALCDACLALPAARRMERVEARLQQQLDLVRRRN